MLVALSIGLINVCITFPSYAQAQVPPSQITDQAAQQQNPQFQEEKNRQLQERIGDITKPPLIPPRIDDVLKSRTKFLITEINIIGAKAVPYYELEKLKKRYINTQMGSEEIDQLMRDIRNLYDNFGYGLVQTAIGDQDISTGKLTISVLEGQLQSLVVCKNGRERRGIDTAFRIPNNSLFRIRRYEQGLDNLDALFTFRPIVSQYLDDNNSIGCNRISTKEADFAQGSSGDILVAPGSEYGLSRVFISTIQPRPFWLSGGSDNYGSSTTGRTRINASLGIEDLFGLYEQIVTRASSTRDFSRGANRARNIGIDLGVPFGYWRINGYYSYYDYRTTIATANQPFVTKGSQQYFGGDISYVIARSRKGVLSVDTGLDIKDTTNFIDDVRLTNSSRRLSVLSIGINYRGSLVGGSYFVGITLNKGLDILGAFSDQNVNRTIPRAQYTNLELVSDFQRSFFLPGTYRQLLEWYAARSSGYKMAETDRQRLLNEPAPFPDFTLRSTLSVTYAPHAVFGSEKIQIGGPFTVRGFDTENLSGDVGGYIRNEVSWYPKVSYRSWALRNIGRPSLFGGFDIGTIINDYAEASQEKTLTGVSFGARIAGRNISGETRVELPVVKPAYFNDRRAIYRFNVMMRL